MKETFFIDSAYISSFEPIVFEDFVGFFLVVEVSREDVWSFEPDDTGFVDVAFFISGCIGHFDSDSGEELSDGSVFGGVDVWFRSFCDWVDDVKVSSRRCFCESVSFLWEDAEFFVE